MQKYIIKKKYIGGVKKECGVFNKITKDTPGKNIAILFFGMAPRSIKYTWESINENIINVLKDNGFNIDIFMHSWLIKSSSNYSSQGDKSRSFEIKSINNNDYKSCT